MGLTNETYYEKDQYMTVSQYKALSKCEFSGLKEFESTLSMLIGSYVDSYVEGTLEQFKAEHPEILSSRGATKGELKSDFKLAEEICRYIDGDRRIQQFLSGEKQTIMTSTIGDIPFKIKMDSYSPNKAIVDLKIMANIRTKRGEFMDFITPWRYDIQLACYQETVRQNTGLTLPCFIVAIEKAQPINGVIVQIPQYILDKALYEVTENLPRLYNVKLGNVLPTGCGLCKDCISNLSETPIITMEDFVDFYN